MNEGFSQVVVGKFMMGSPCAGYKGREVEVSGNVLWLRAADFPASHLIKILHCCLYRHGENFNQAPPEVVRASRPLCLS